MFMDFTLNGDLVKKVIDFLKGLITQRNERAHGIAVEVHGDNNTVVISPAAEADIQTYNSSIGKSVPVVNAVGRSGINLYIQGSFYGGEKRSGEGVSIGTYLSCQIGEDRLPLFKLGVFASEEIPCSHIYIWCPRKALEAFGLTNLPKEGFGKWKYDKDDDAFFMLLTEEEERKRDLRKSLKEKLRELHDKDKRGVEGDIATGNLSSLEDRPRREKT